MSSDQIAPLLADTHVLTILGQTRSFTQTARRLNVSKASVSMRIGDLERAIGVPLVNRTTRSVSLTEAGRQLVDDCASAFERIDAGLTAAKDLSGEPRGIVRVTAPVAFGRQHLAPRLSVFLQRFPEVRIQLELTDRLVNLTHEGFDLAIRHTSLAPENYVASPLCQTSSVLVASPAYLRRRGFPAHPSELANHECLLYLGDSDSATWTFMPVQGKGVRESVSVRVHGPLMANNSEVLREAMLDGMGIALLPDFSAVSSSRRRATQVLDGWRAQGFFGSQIFALRPWTRRVPRSVQCFVEFLRETFAEQSLVNA